MSLHDFEERQSIKSHIEEFGYHLVIVEGDSYLPGYVYTIGLFEKYDHPELACFGLSIDDMVDLIKHAVSGIKEEERYLPSKLYGGFLDEYEVQFINVAKDFYPPYFGYACWYYGRKNDFPIMQLIWPDGDDDFPWEDDFDPEHKLRQPLLDRSTDFWFYEFRNLGVFTTHEVMEGTPILYVYHNKSGDWQFHCQTNLDLSTGKLVALDEVVKLDPSVNEVFDLSYGWEASRKDKKSAWEYKEDNSDDE